MQPSRSRRSWCSHDIMPLTGRSRSHHLFPLAPGYAGAFSAKHDQPPNSARKLAPIPPVPIPSGPGSGSIKCPRNSASKRMGTLPPPEVGEDDDFDIEAELAANPPRRSRSSHRMLFTAFEFRLFSISA